MIVTINKYIEDINKNLQIMNLDNANNDNFNRSIKYAYIHKDDEFDSANDVKKFIEDIVLIVNEGTLTKDNIYRNNNHYIELLTEKLFTNYKKNYDPIYLASICDYYLDLRGQIFNDDGKSSLIVSAYCLMRKDIGVASYISRKLYLSYGPRGNDAIDVRRFHKYYQMIHKAKDLWNEYTTNNKVKDDKYDIVHYDYDTIELLLDGSKNAISSLKKINDINNIDLPYINEYKIIFDKKDEAVGIIRVEDVKVIKYKDVSYDFALAEGEGDYTLAYWKYVHKNKFVEQCLDADLDFDINDEVVCEYIKLVCKVVYE